MIVATVKSTEIINNGRRLDARSLPEYRTRLLRQERDKLARLVERHNRRIQQIEKELKI